MALSLTQHAANADATSGTTVVTTVTATQANALLVAGCMGKNSLTVTSVTDNKGNTYTQVPSAYCLSSGGRWSDLWYCGKGIAGVTTVTLTVSGTASTNRRDLEVWEVSAGANGGTLDGNGATLANSVTGGSGSWIVSGPSLTTTNANDFIAAIDRTSGSFNGENDTTFTVSDTTADGAYSSVIVAATGTYHPTWKDSNGTSIDTATSMAAFKAASSSAWSGSGSATISPTTTASRLGVFLRVAGLIESFVTTASGVVSSGSQSWSGSGSATVTPAPVSSRLVGYLRQRTMGDGQLLGLGLVPSIPSLVAPSTTRAVSYLRALGATVAPSTAPTRSMTLARLAAAVSSLTPTGVRTAVMGRSQGATMTPTPTGTGILGLVRSAGTTLSTLSADVRALLMGRSAGPTVSATATGGRLLTMLRVGGATLTVVMSPIRLLTMLRSAGPTLTAITGTGRLLAALRSAGTTLTVSITDSNVLQSAGSFVRSAGVSLFAVTTAPRSLVMGRSQAVIGVVTPTGSRAMTVLRSAGATLAAVPTGLRSTVLARASSVALVSATTGARLVALPRGAGIALAAVTTTTRAMVLGRQSSSVVAALTSASGTGSFSLPLVQIAAWAAARARKGIEELVLAYQSIQSRLGHTQDTQANFDAGFTTFSGEVVAPPDFPDPAPVPEVQTDGLDAWVQSRLHPGNYESVMAFAALQRVANNYAASSATYDTLYAAFIQEQEPTPWPH